MVSFDPQAKKTLIVRVTLNGGIAGDLIAFLAAPLQSSHCVFWILVWAKHLHHPPIYSDEGVSGATDADRKTNAQNLSTCSDEASLADAAHYDALADDDVPKRTARNPVASRSNRPLPPEGSDRPCTSLAYPN